MGRTVLIDADILIFQVAVNHEEAYDFNGVQAVQVDEEEALVEIGRAIESIIERTDSDQAALFLTGTNNFRKTVLSTYKGNRVGVKKPALLQPLRQELLENYPRVFIEDQLEGDDLIGIHATMPHKGERVIYSADKDLKTIPGLHWDNDDGEPVEIDEIAADRFFYEQVITGDPTDNYAGCPGAGPKAASILLDGHQRWVSYVHTFKSGPRKGLEETRWKLEPLHSEEGYWPSVVSAYAKAGLTEEDALVQARCARILRHGEYNFKKQKVNLWNPPS